MKKMNKKQVCQMIAGLVAICAIVSGISTVDAFRTAVETGGDKPISMVIITLVTVVCAVVIWRNVRNMDE